MLKPNLNVLDIGSGTGFPLIEVAQRLGSTCEAFGIDPWQQAVERINLKIRTYNLTNVKAVKGVAEHLPFENQYFGLVVSNNGINNVNDATLALSECYRVSRPDAQFVLTLNLEDTMKEFYQVYGETLIQRGLQDKVAAMKRQIYNKRRPLHETRFWLEKAGFEIQSINHDHFTLRFLTAKSLFHHALIKYWFLDGWKRILDDSVVEAVFRQMEDKLDEIAKEEGEIRLTIPFVTIDCRRK